MNWILLWLFLHILAAVIAFGPIFVFPIIGTLVARSPQNIHFAIELTHRIESRLVLPLALSMLVSGSGLIWSTGIDFFHTWYLIVAVALYLYAMGVAFRILLPTTQRMLRMVESAHSAEGGGDALSGLPALMKRNQVFGGSLMVVFLIIIFLMIIQPGGTAFR